MKNPKHKYDPEFKERIVAEFVKGDLSAAEIAKREGIEPIILAKDCWLGLKSQH
jgi:transposase-like protein